MELAKKLIDLQEERERRRLELAQEQTKKWNILDGRDVIATLNGVPIGILQAIDSTISFNSRREVPEIDVDARMHTRPLGLHRIGMGAFETEDIIGGMQQEMSRRLAENMHRQIMRDVAGLGEDPNIPITREGVERQMEQEIEERRARRGILGHPSMQAVSEDMRQALDQLEPEEREIRVARMAAMSSNIREIALRRRLTEVEGMENNDRAINLASEILQDEIRREAIVLGRPVSFSVEYACYNEYGIRQGRAERRQEERRARLKKKQEPIHEFKDGVRQMMGGKKKWN